MRTFGRLPYSALAIIASVATMLGAAPANADKPKIGSIIKGVPNCLTSPPKCFVLSAPAPPKGTQDGQPSRRGDVLAQTTVGLAPRVPRGTTPKSILVQGCLSSNGDIQISDGHCPKGTLDVLLVY